MQASNAHQLALPNSHQVKHSQFSSFVSCLWIQLVELRDRQQGLVMFAKLGVGVQVTEYSRAEVLALEALCSQPQQAGGGGDRKQRPDATCEGKNG